MNKLLILLGLCFAPTLINAQSATLESNISSEKIQSFKSTLAAKKKTERISDNPREQTNMTFKKSIDIISVKAYIKSLQIKGDYSLNS
jgi:hypothetical protein